MTHRPSPRPRTAPEISLAAAVLIIGLTWLVLAAMRLTAPTDLMNNDQERPAAYVMDALANGQWIVQRDDTGDITSKPPLVTWITAAGATLLGGFNEFTLYLPQTLFILVTALIVFFVGDRAFGRWPALLAVAAYLFSNIVIKQFHLARTDTLFALLVFSSLVLLHRASLGKVPWIAFWVVAALATMTKGPLGLVLAAGGLPALFWERRTRWQEGRPQPSLGTWKEHLVGAGLFVALPGSWFLLAVWSGGQPVFDKMVGDELVGLAVEKEGDGMIADAYKPWYYFLIRYLPWSLVVVAAVVSVFRKPWNTARGRYFERLLVSYVLVGLAVFTLGAHKRGDHVIPLVIGGALLAGRELARWWHPVPSLRLLRNYIIVLVLFVSGFAAYYHLIWVREVRLQNSRMAMDFAQYVDRDLGPTFPLMSVDMPYAVQFHRGTMHQRVPVESALRALSSDAAAYVVVREWKDYWWHFRGHEVVLQWPQDAEEPLLRVISNRPELAWDEFMIAYLDGVRAELFRAEILPGGDRRPVFRTAGPRAEVRLTNDTAEPRTLRAGFDGERRQHLALQPGETIILRPGRAE